MVFGISKDMFELGKRMIREESNLGREKFATLEEDRGNNFNLDSSINGSQQCSKQWPRNRPTSRNLWQLGHLIRLVSRWLSLRTCHSRDNYRFAYEIPRNFTILARWIILDELKFTRYYDDFSNRTSQKFQLQFLRNVSSCLRLFTIKLSNWDSYI